MNYRNYDRRVQSVQWAYEYKARAVESRDSHRASRAALLINALENWLNQNAPLTLTTYKD